MSDTNAEAEVLFSQEGPIGVITLNRPKALNALNLEMIRAMLAMLRIWAVDPNVRAVLIVGSGDRAFCAGGDVKSVYQAGLAARAGEGDGAMTRDFFREEYQLNRAIYRFPKPYIAMIDGITMGGGVGLSVHGSHRVATERTMLAMPETAIGLFPDVGATYVLARAPGEIGLYLALTGERIGAADALHAGLATHHVASDRLPALRRALVEADWAAVPPEAPKPFVTSIIEGFSSAPAPGTLAAQQPMIDAVFAASDVEAIRQQLVAQSEAEGEAAFGWAAATLETLDKRSPTSLKVTFEQLSRGQALDLESCLVMEYRQTQGCMAGEDFYEGIRAVLIDKDHAPVWRPATLAEVTPDMVERHFAPPADGDLTFG